MADEMDPLIGYYGDPKRAYEDPLVEKMRTSQSEGLPPLVKKSTAELRADPNLGSKAAVPGQGDWFTGKATDYVGPNATVQGVHGLGELGAKTIADAYYNRKIDPETLVPLLGMAIAPGVAKKGALEVSPRELVNGSYSQALEAAKAWPQAKGTPEQALAYLKSQGTKDAEIAATGLPRFLEGKPQVSRDDLATFLRKNRVPVRESVYGDTEGTNPKWADYSLDPSNPTYRETVLHLPHTPRHQVKPSETAAAPYMAEWNRLSREIDAARAVHDDIVYGRNRGRFPTQEGAKLNLEALEAQRDALHSKMVDDTIAQSNGRLGGEPFQSGHWSEPNVIAHMRTGMYTDAQGRPVYLLDELQSDWGQKLREGGVRDEGKIAQLNRDIIEHRNATVPLLQEGEDLARSINKGPLAYGGDVLNNLMDLSYQRHEYKNAPPEVADRARDLAGRIVQADNRTNLLAAELRTAEAATHGHPLVDTTDQWTTTALRRFLQQAHEAGAEGVAITPGLLQNERFNLARQVGGLRYDPEMKQLQYQLPGEKYWAGYDKAVEPGELGGVVGKEVAEKLLAQPRKYESAAYSVKGPHTLTGEGLEIGGQGMKYAYDQMYPKQLEKILRKMDKEHPGRSQTEIMSFDPVKELARARELSTGSLVDQSRIRDLEASVRAGVTGTYSEPFHYFPLTPAAKARIAKGLPLFSAAAGAPLVADILRQPSPSSREE